MKRVLILILGILLTLSIAGVFTWSMLTDGEFVFLVPLVLMLAFCAVFVFLLFKEIFIGYNEYTLDGARILVNRRGRRVTDFEAMDVENLVFVCDMISKEVEIIIFRYRKKRFYISLKPDNRDAFLSVFAPLPHSTKSNFLYYLILLF